MLTREDILKLMKEGEGIHFEAKSAKGGFPDSFWDTYSSFANTDGGIIVLGLKENPKNGKLFVEGLPDPAKIRKDFFNMLNNRQKISINLLTDKMVYPLKIDDKEILVVEIPRADRTIRPIYKGLDPRTGTFHRIGEGDSLCTPDELASLIRDAVRLTVDTTVLEKMDENVFCMDTVRSYRQIFRDTLPRHLWNNVDDIQFLRYLGAMALGEDGLFHPTAAGLLMFGWEYEIIREFPDYFLDYQEHKKFINTRWTDRIVSSSGEWSGNLFDFALKVSHKLVSDLKVPFVMKGMLRIDDTPVHQMLREAVTNTLTNADYYGRRGVVIVKKEDGFEFHNPGNMRVALNTAIQGSVSDPRGSTLLRIFSHVKFGERAGYGISTIFSIWPKIFHVNPEIRESAESVYRTSLYLPMPPEGPDIQEMLKYYDSAPIDIGEITFEEPETRYPGRPLSDDRPAKRDEKVSLQRSPMRLKGEALAKEILEILSETPQVTIDELAQMCGVSSSTIKRKIKSMPEVSYVGPAKTGSWRIESNPE